MQPFFLSKHPAQGVATSPRWQVKQRSPGLSVQADLASDAGWIDAEVPGSAHEAFVRAGKIGSPYQQDSLRTGAWLSDQSVLFRCRFEAPTALLAEGDPVSLQLDSLDTVAHVLWNGVEVAQSDNMFVPVRRTVTLQPGQNELALLFLPPLAEAQARQALHGPRPVWNGDPSRVYLRKAQYHFGWDFSPTLLSSGPAGPISLCAASARLADVHAPIELSEDLQAATLSLSAALEISRAHRGPYVLDMKLTSPTGNVLTAVSLPFVSTVLAHKVAIAQPALWWPRQHGSQPLYRLELALRQGERVLETRTMKLGIRRLRLIEAPLPGGQTFYFEINNRAIFCGGANWIPADVLPGRISTQQYEQLVREAAEGELSMLRVWGGGLYEDDRFYDLCDELGILVWQDFAFACGLYPAHDSFRDSVAAEARHQVLRLRHHAALVLWAGNNEDYSIAQSVSAYAGPHSPRPAPGHSSLSSPRFDGRWLYEETLSRVCAEHDPSRPYWPGSPYSRTSADPNDPKQGDRHIWDVWHGPMHDYQTYGQLAGRFASEFGMQAVPDRAIVERALAPRPVEIPQLALLNFGQEGPERIQRYLDRNLPAPTDVDGYIYATQVVQAEALAHAVAAFRRGFDATRSCGGALIWQLADCWPSVSWAMIAFCDENQPTSRKASFYAVRRELLPFVVGIEHTQLGHITPWMVAPHDAPPTVELRLCVYSPAGELVQRTRQTCSVRPNQAQDLPAVKLPPGTGPLVLAAELWHGERTLARRVCFPQPLVALALPDPGLVTTRIGDTVHITSKGTAKAVYLSTSVPLALSDNLFDMLPGESRTVSAPGLGQQPLTLRSLFGAPQCI